MTAPRIATCPTCNASLTDGDRFCKQCGADVSGISASLTLRSADDWTGTPVPETSPTVGSPWETVLARLRESTRGEFDVGRELGRGGMAAVFLAQDLALNRKVAIKVMAPGLMMGEGMVQRFRQEAITIANLSHAHIVSIHAVRQAEDLHFFVMQFVEGQSLETVLRTHGRLPVPVVRAVLFQVGSALAYAHRRGVVHRDIKPGNILMSGEGDALVTDFGIAKVAEGPNQTQTGMVVGTPTYMSPEQCYATDLSGASDQYSLGIVAFQMLTGQTPYNGSAFAIMKGHTTDPVPSMRALAPDVPEEVEAAVARMLAKSPSDRFTTFGEALAAMGAHSVGEDAPMRGELIRLAAVEERRAALGSLLHTPSGPVSRSRVRSSSGATPQPRTPPPSAATVPMTAVAIAPLAGELEPGDTATMRASVRGAETEADIVWSAEPASVVQIDADSGLLTALAPGEGEIVATVGHVTERTRCVVVPPRVAAVRITAHAEPMHVGESASLVAQPVDKREQPIEGVVEWGTVGTALSVNHAGVAQAQEVGRSAVTASCDGVYATVVIQVLAARVSSVTIGLPDEPVEIGHAVTLEVVLRDAAGTELTNRSVRWSVDDPARARIDAAGVFTALAEGVAKVTATSEGVTSSRDLRIPPPRVTSVVIASVPEIVRVGDRFVLKAQPRDARGRPLERAIVWRSAEPSVATVDAKGAVRAHGTGAARIVATSDGVEVTAAFMVHQVPAAFTAPPVNTDAPPASATAVLSAMAGGPAPSAPAARGAAAPPPVAGPAAAPPSAPAARPASTPPVTPETKRPLPSQPIPVEPVPGSGAGIGSEAGSGAGSGTGSGLRIPRWALGAAVVPVLAVVVWVATRGGGGSVTPSGGGSADSTTGVEPGPDTSNLAGLRDTSGSVLPIDPDGNVTQQPPDENKPPRDSTTTRPDSAVAAPTRLVLRMVNPSSSNTLDEGQTLSLKVTAVDSGTGASVNAPIRFSSNDRSVALVNRTTGEVTAQKAGTVTITAAAANARSTSLRLSVQPAAVRIPAETTITSTNSPPNNPPAADTTRRRDLPPTPPTISQAQLAQEARSVIEAYAAAISSRDLNRVRAIYPTVSPSYVGTLRSMFEFSREVRVSVTSVTLVDNEYTRDVGSSTRVVATVSQRIVPVRGSAESPSTDRWPVTLERTATGWRLRQVGGQ